MSKENKSRYAILGMLSSHPMSGYDIKKFMEQSTSNFWSESYGQIYPILKQLTDEGLTTSHTEKQEGKPERYVYTLTDKGWDDLGRWLTEPIEHTVERNELLLKLFFGGQVPVSVSLEHVQRYQELQMQLLRKYAAIEEQLKADCIDDPNLPYWLMTVSYGRYRVQALFAWCDETLATLQELAENGVPRGGRPLGRSAGVSPDRSPSASAGGE
jgi:PadR family transcriptional regulator AphA